MKKLKQLSLMLFISVGLFSCETEKVDEVVKDEFLQGQPVFRYDMDGISRTTNNVTVSQEANSITLTAIINDKHSEYQPQTFKIHFNRMQIGAFPSTLVQGIDLVCNASFKHQNVTWLYGTENANSGVNAGSMTILSINESAKYFEGKFKFDLYAPKAQNPTNLIPPIKVTNGYFQYVKI